jgi:H+-transporting ATPase
VQALKDSLSPKAHVKRDGEWHELNARELVPGDLVSLALGCTVPADCQVLGPKQIYCDQAALTGESLPVKIDVGDKAKMGSNVTTGECDAVVTGTGDKTFFGKTAKLIAGVHETGHFQKVLYKITGVLMGMSLVLTGIILASLIISNVNALEALGICVVLLVASIPIAMQVVCTSTMAIGSRKLAEKKAIVTRLAAIEELAGMNMLCSDKTGTLTLGKMQMQDILVYAYADASADIGLLAAGGAGAGAGAQSLQSADILRFACLAAKWYEPPRDAIDRLVIGSAESGEYGDIFGELDDFEHIDYMPFDPKYKRTESQVRSRSDQSVEYKVTKGAPQVILSMCSSCPSEQTHAISNKISELAARGIRSLGIAVCKAQVVEGGAAAAAAAAAAPAGETEEGGDVEVGFTNWRFIGILTFLDPPRHDTKQTIERALNLGIDVKMITGDQVAIAKETCFQLGMGTNIRGTELIPDGETASSADAIRFEEIIVELDGFAEVFPEHKYQIVDTFRKIGYRCGMTGDGVNDAPALKRADIGIAVQGATDAARAAADIVLTQEGLSVIIDAIYISRKIFKRMKNYVTYRIA